MSFGSEWNKIAKEAGFRLFRHLGEFNKHIEQKLTLSPKYLVEPKLVNRVE